MEVDEGILTEVGNDDQPMEINDGSVNLSQSHCSDVQVSCANSV
jgi:hypothetical protein